MYYSPWIWVVVYTILNNYLTENWHLCTKFEIIILSSQKYTNLYNFDHEERVQLFTPASVFFFFAYLMQLKRSLLI